MSLTTPMHRHARSIIQRLAALTLFVTAALAPAQTTSPAAGAPLDATPPPAASIFADAIAHLLPPLVQARPLPQFQITPPAPEFPVFDALLYQDKPSFDQYPPVRRLHMVYTSALWGPGKSRVEPDEAEVRAAARRIPPQTIVCLDIEHWPVDTDEATARESLRKYLLVLRWMREENPTLQLGYYGVLPVRDYWNAIRDPDDPRYQRWVAKNQRLAPLAEQVDFVFPSLYALYADQKGWRKFALANLQQARQYGRPVYPFLWPQYHESNHEIGEQYIPPDFWRLQLETVVQHADGVVLWGGWQQTWNEHAPWWQVTRRFLSRLNHLLQEKNAVD